MEPLRVSLVDMNNGVPNEAVRCFRRLLEAFSSRVRAANPRLKVVLEHVQPRNLGELPSPDADLVLSTGGPGSPHDGWEERWCAGYRVFLDSILERAAADAERAPSAFVVCHSFEIAVQHFRFAEMTRRQDLKFAIFPAYLTEEANGQAFHALRRAPLRLGAPPLAGGGPACSSAGPATGRGAGHGKPARAEGQGGGPPRAPLRPWAGGGLNSTQRRTVPAFWLGFIARSTPPHLGTPMATHCSSG